jgi:hypothetical protein
MGHLRSALCLILFGLSLSTCPCNRGALLPTANALRGLGWHMEMLQLQPYQPHVMPPAMQVVKQSVLEPYGYQGREVHRIPLVPDIVSHADPATRTLYITPPPGEACQPADCPASRHCHPISMQCNTVQALL